MKVFVVLSFALAFLGCEAFNGKLRDREFPERPVSFFNRIRQVKSVQNANAPGSGRPLRDYESTTNNRLKATIERVNEIGQPLAMRCEAPKDKTIASCAWTSPDGNIFEPNARVVGGKICQVQVTSLSEDQLGIWSCKVQLNDEDQYQEAYVTATKTLPVQDVRLPRHLNPIDYRMYLTPFIIEGNFTIEGYVEIDIDVLKSGSNNVTMHIKDITVYENLAIVTDLDTDGQITVEGHGYDNDRDFYVLKLDKELNKGQKIKVALAFEGELNDKLAGFYRSTYEDSETNTTRYLATTQMEATDARRALPCFDEPSFKAKFQVNLGRTKDMTSISNMPIKNEAVAMADNDEYVWDEFETSVKMSTYLLAFVVSDFAFRKGTETSNGVLFRIWSRENLRPQTEYAADIGPKILQHYEDYFDIPFPLPKQDMIAVPDFSAGAMENWGLITYREVALLFEKGVSSRSNKEYIATVVAHELAHQWFGDLVTMEWWDDLWLNEGFASYVEKLGASFVEPDTGLMQRFALDEMYPTFASDALRTSHPISVKVHHPNEIDEIFDGISYGKGACIIRMMANFLGEDSFNHGLTKYLNKHKYDNAVQDDLWESLTEVAHQERSLDQALSVKEIMDTWTLQMGFPVVNVDRDYSSNKVTFKQQRYLTDYSEEEKSDDDHVYKWWIPINYEIEGGSFGKTHSMFWLDPNAKDLKKTTEISGIENDKALIVNVQQTGYYRVNYDDKNWELIAKTLQVDPDKIHLVNRGQIMDDAFNLARSGLLKYEIALDMTKYLYLEREYIPWSSALRGFSYINLMFKRTGGYGLLKKYMTSELVRPYRSLGFDFKSDSTFMDDLLRVEVIESMCSLGYDNCQAQGRDLFGIWMETTDPDQDNPINPAIRSTVYCQALKQGDEKEWGFLWRRYKNSNNAGEKKTILRALACTNEVWILQQYLDMSVRENSGIRRQDASTVVVAVARNQVGRYLTWNWLRNNWDEITAYFDTAIMSSIGDFVLACTRDFNTPFELKELEDFYELHKDELGTANRATLNAMEAVRANVRWMESHYETIVDWLSKNLE